MDKVSETRRRMFEAWFLKNYSWFIENNRCGYSLERFTTRPFQYIGTIPHHDWRVFNAALDAVEIVLPRERKVRSGWQEAAGADMAFNDCLEYCVDAIESTNLGLRIK